MRIGKEKVPAFLRKAGTRAKVKVHKVHSDQDLSANLRGGEPGR